MMRFLIVDDHDIVLQGIRRLVENAYPGAEIAEACEARAALVQVRGGNWDAILLDISMPGMSGLEVLQQIKATYPKLPVLMLSAHTEKMYAIRAFKLGASGFVNKDNTRQELLTALQTILAGNKYVAPTLAGDMAAYLFEKKSSPEREAGALPHEQLSDRELEVLTRLAKGEKVGDIAIAMGLSVSAVSTYRGRILKKLDADGTADLIRYAVEHGLRI